MRTTEFLLRVYSAPPLYIIAPAAVVKKRVAWKFENENYDTVEIYYYLFVIYLLLFDSSWRLCGLVDSSYLTSPGFDPGYFTGGDYVVCVGFSPTVQSHAMRSIRHYELTIEANSSYAFCKETKIGEI